MRKFLLLLGVICSLLTGCSEPYFQEYHTITYANYHRTLAARSLTQSGAIILSTPKDVSIILPAKMLFNRDSANFIDLAYNRLDLVANYLKYFEKIDIQVLAFANRRDLANSSTLGALTLNRAQKVAQYLWSQEPDARLISADGYEMKTMRRGTIVLSDCVMVYFPKS